MNQVANPTKSISTLILDFLPLKWLEIKSCCLEVTQSVVFYYCFCGLDFTTLSVVRIPGILYKVKLCTLISWEAWLTSPSKG